MSSTELAAYAPGLDWNAWFAGASIGPQKRIIVNENTAIRDIAALYAKTPLDTLKLWQEFHVADNAANYLSKDWVDSRTEEHMSELQSLMRISYAVFCLKNKKTNT